ncbi:MAG: hypothetical protein SPI59_06155 [Finegoldia sp.]|nr:hypothetical protein [Finegoldia sp.]
MKSDLFEHSIIILLSIIFCIFIVKNTKSDRSFYLIILKISSLFLAGSTVIDYFLYFTDYEKIIANSTIDKILIQENIGINEDNLGKLIATSKCIGSRESRIFREIKGSCLFISSKSFLFTFLGIVIGYFSTNINSVSADEFFNNLGLIFGLFLSIWVFISVFNILIYGINKWINRNSELYIQVLIDKKLTLSLHK